MFSTSTHGSTSAIRRTAIAAALLLALPAQAQDEPTGFLSEVKGNVALTTAYIFRGIDQSDENVALQGGLDWAGQSGFSLGVWGSTVDFNDGDQASTEVDLYGAYAIEAGGITWGVTGIAYLYPGADTAIEYDFFEVGVFASGELGPAAVKASVNWSPEFFAESGDAVFWNLGVTVPLVEGFALDGQVGYQSIDLNGAFGTPDYTVYGGGLTYSFARFAAAIRFTGTDIERPQCFAATTFCNDALTLTLSTSF